jgi:microcystin degradation protein MlrC
MARVLVGQLWHESHGFNPLPTGRERFTLAFGDAVFAAQAAAGSTLGGILRTLEALGHTPVPTVAAQAPPAGPVEHGLYEELKAAILERAGHGDVDAVALELHGAMQTDRLADVEGDLLPALRRVVGGAMPIGVGYDLHAHVSDAMLSAANITIACKENPHADVVDAGRDVARAVDAMLAGRLAPVTVAARAPMVLAGGWETRDAPLVELHALAKATVAADPGLRDASIFNAFPFVDAPGLGQSFVVTADAGVAGAVGRARTLAARLARYCWDERSRFRDDFADIPTALAIVARDRDRRPFALADIGDRVLAGAPGDSTAILAALLARGDLSAAVPVTCPTSAAAAIAAGVGATVTLAVGGRATPGFAPLKVTGRVRGVGDGRFVLRGPYQAGQTSSLGPAAVLEVGRVLILLTSLPGFTQDPEAFLSQGIDPAALDLVVVKSGNHFKLCFAGLATPLEVATPGLGTYNPGIHPYRRARFHPETPIADPDLSARIYSGGAVAPTRPVTSP